MVPPPQKFERMWFLIKQFEWFLYVLNAQNAVVHFIIIIIRSILQILMQFMSLRIVFVHFSINEIETK